MVELTIFNIILILINVGIIYLCKKYFSEKKNLVLLIVAISTILCHYSSLLYHQIVNGTPLVFLKENPNLILPIYPCNVVMWSCLIFGLIKNKESKLGKFLVNYIFWFGLFSSLIGMIVNVDFIQNPTLKNYDVTKGIIAHSILLLNVLLLKAFGYLKFDFKKNMIHMVISVVMMFFIGCYCNLVFYVISTPERAFHVNSMFLIHSPFEGVDFLTYPFIALVALILYFIVFTVIDLIKNEKGNRWFNKINLNK